MKYIQFVEELQGHRALRGHSKYLSRDLPYIERIAVCDPLNSPCRSTVYFPMCD